MIRDISGGPFAWVEKAALRRLRDGCDDNSYLAGATAVYLALAEMASDAQSETFTASKRRISERSGVSPRQVYRIQEKLTALGLVKVRENFVDGSSEQGPCTFTLLQAVPPASDTVGTATQTVPPATQAVGTAKIQNGAVGRVIEEYIEESPEESEKKVAHAPIPSLLKEIANFGPEWQAFREHRRKLRKPMTDRVEELLLATLAERPQQAVAALQVAMVQGWQCVRWEWLDHRNESSRSCHAESLTSTGASTQTRNGMNGYRKNDPNHPDHKPW